MTSSNMLLYIAHHRRQTCMMMQLWSTVSSVKDLCNGRSWCKLCVCSLFAER